MMKSERHIQLLVTALPVPNLGKRKQEIGGYRVWTIGKKSSFLLPIASCLLPSLVHAQPIISAHDGTGTLVTPNGNQFDIHGGQIAGGNLFHSFQRFGLNRGQVANFLSDAAIKNILARVTGGEPSFINGLLQVTGGSPNLYLMNPAGIVFGPHAQLNIPASFTATTASGIGFGDNWFQAFGPNNYSRLVGTPSAFAFPNAEPAAIVNEGNLAVNPEQNLTLIGGTVISIGTLEAPGGQITLAAIPGEKVVRISQEGRLLNLEIAALPPESGLWTPEAKSFTPLSLPEMLTGGDIDQAAGVAINPEGQVVLTGSNQGINVDPGTVIVAGTVDVSSSTSTAGPTLQMGGSVEILGDRILLSSAKINASGMQGGGTVELSQSSSEASIYVSNDSTILADAIASGRGGRVAIGRWGGLMVSDFEGHISAQGGATDGEGGTVTLSSGGNFAGTIDLSAANGMVGTLEINSENISVTSDPSDRLLMNSGKLAISQTSLEDASGHSNIILNATNDIAIDRLQNQSLNLKSSGVGQSITLTADTDNNGVGSVSMMNPETVISTQGAAINISGEHLSLSKIDAHGGAINLKANQIQLRGGDNSISSVGGLISIAPKAPDRSIQIGGNLNSDSTALHLSHTDMKALSNGFKSITIDGQAGRGVITVESVEVQDPLILQSPEGTIQIQGEIIGKDDASVTLNGRSTVLNANITTENQDININSSVTLTNSVELKTGDGGGNIAIAGPINSEIDKSHDLTVAAGTGDVTLRGPVGTEPHQQIGDLTLESANNVQVYSTLAASNVKQLAGTGRVLLTEVHTTGKEGVNITTRGEIQTGHIASNGGDIRLTSQTSYITTGNLDPSLPDPGKNTLPSVRDNPGGRVNLKASGNIQTGTISTTGRTGEVTLASVTGNIVSDSIQSGYADRPDVSTKPAHVSQMAGVSHLASTLQQAAHHPSIADSHDSLLNLDRLRSQEFAKYFGVDFDNQQLSSRNIQDSLQEIDRKTARKTGVIYITPRSEHLELVLVTADGSPIFKRIVEAKGEAVRRNMQKFIGNISHRPDPNNANAYLSASQQLYQWFIAPLESELQQQNIDTLAFSLDPSMRSLPLAALHDGQQFLVQKYSIGLIPSLNLTDTSYQSINNLSVLAMGASEFKDPKVVPLPAVPVELSTITQDWQGTSFMNQDFTLDNLKKQRNKGEFGIVHLATHGSFDPATPSNSYIQLWDGKLRFDQLRELGKHRLELLVLSACETAFGSQEAELGFAGLAVQSGVKSVLASLWQVDDAGTLGLMSEFYRQLGLQGVTVKAEALRQAQMAMIQGDLRVEGGQLRSTSRGSVALPQSDERGVTNLSHPYYWASFTMIGNLW